MSNSYRNIAGEVVAEHGRYIGDWSPEYDYFIRFEGKAYFANCTDALANKVASAMRSSAAKSRSAA